MEPKRYQFTDYSTYHVKRSWVASIRRAVQAGDGDAAYRLTVGLVRRLRELSGSTKFVEESTR